MRTSSVIDMVITHDGRVATKSSGMTASALHSRRPSQVRVVEHHKRRRAVGRQYRLERVRLQ